MQQILCLGVFLVFYCLHVDACSCFFGHPQDYFCRAKFAITGTIVDKYLLPPPTATPEPGPGPISEKIVYIVRVEEEFKPLDHNDVMLVGPLKYITMETSTQSNLCGLTGLKRNVPYLLTGSTGDTGFRVNLCDLVLRWEFVDSQMLTYLRVEYGGCECKVTSHLIEDTVDTCYYNMTDVYAGESMCVKTFDSECDWIALTIN